MDSRPFTPLTLQHLYLDLAESRAARQFGEQLPLKQFYPVQFARNSVNLEFSGEQLGDWARSRVQEADWGFKVQGFGFGFVQGYGLESFHFSC